MLSSVVILNHSIFHTVQCLVSTERPQPPVCLYFVHPNDSASYCLCIFSFSRTWRESWAYAGSRRKPSFGGCRRYRRMTSIRSQTVTPLLATTVHLPPTWNSGRVSPKSRRVEPISVCVTALCAVWLVTLRFFDAICWQEAVIICNWFPFHVRREASEGVAVEEKSGLSSRHVAASCSDGRWTTFLGTPPRFRLLLGGLFISVFICALLLFEDMYTLRLSTFLQSNNIAKVLLRDLDLLSQGIKSDGWAIRNLLLVLFSSFLRVFISKFWPSSYFILE